MSDLVPFARTISDRTDAEVLDFVRKMEHLDSKSRQNDRVATARLIEDLARRVRELAEINRIGCGRVSCMYPNVVGLMAGVDVSIDGDIWPDSPYARHIARCPWHQGPATRRALDHSVDDVLLTRPDPAAVDTAMAEVHEILVDAGTMDAIRRVRAFQQAADENGFGRPVNG